MKREEVVFKSLEEMCSKKYTPTKLKNLKRVGVSAQELSDILNMDRGNISKDLNELFKKQKLIKFIGRPTLFFPTHILEKALNLEVNIYEINSIDDIISKKDDSIYNVIGLQGSLKSCFDQLKVAVVYPPFGLHTLFYGKTGVGKSMFADLMNSIAQRDMPEKFQSYITFNCADYSHNPNFLMTELFGCIKGAYTGADTARTGIVENANNGILFLDEVHRLPPEGQEMLFYVMDRGLFRRVGETKEFTKVNVLIVCATTEKPENVLLPTFYRRIPMKVYIPDYTERPISERKKLVELYFNEECRVLNKTFKVENQIIDLLCEYDCKGNIGQLKNDIKLISARAFAQTIANDKTMIDITYEDASKVIGNNILPKNKNISYIMFDGKDAVNHNLVNTNDELYENLLNKLNELSLQYYSKEEIEKLMNKEINEYFHLDSKDNIDNEAVKRFVENDVIEISKIVLDLAKSRLDKNYNNSNILTLALHLKTTIDRLRKGYIIKNKKLNYIRKKYPKEFIVALEAGEKIEKKMDVDIPLSEIGFLTLLIVSLDIKSSYGRVGVLVVCHGDSIATSMLDLANKMLGKNVGKAIDVPLEKGTEITISEIVQGVKKVDHEKGVLILIDMGLVANTKEIIQEKSGVKVEIVENVSTPMLIRSIEKSLMFDGTVTEFRKEIYVEYCEKPTQGYSVNNITTKNIIIIYCITGRGTSVRLKEYINDNINKTLLEKVEIYIEDEEFINLGEDKVNEKYGNKVLAVIGNFKNKFSNTTFISAEEILLQDGIGRLTDIIKNVNGYDPYKEGEVSLCKVLKFVNPIMLVKVFKGIILDFEKNFDRSIDKKVITVIILHLGCMVEDLIMGKNLKSFEDTEIVNEKYSFEARYFREKFKHIENTFNIAIPDSEIARVMEIMIEN
ncbi:sigma 54-interacting transcriptional regulator [Clostridium intestinale]|uniref:sigma 54-interacting transcriptional regulator n=1 Tax=Clostridium intestinale TaxID=36845 RepID=UPI0028E81297|nr:sigma 54-interacting transcriptional regulator [Clostridium intestinale]